jgi:hypothetical protein
MRFRHPELGPWSDGTTGFLFSPTELLEKLVALRNLSTILRHSPSSI